MRLSGADGGGIRQSRGRVLRVALVGDPQVDDQAEMGYAPVGLSGTARAP